MRPAQSHPLAHEQSPKRLPVVVVGRHRVGGFPFVERCGVPLLPSIAARCSRTSRSRQIAGAGPSVLSVLSAATGGVDIARAAGELTETAPGATTILSRNDGDLGVRRDRLGGRSRAKQQPPRFRTI